MPTTEPENPPARAGASSPRDPKGDRAADRIRRSARELFYREGIRAVGVDEIVSRAGVSKPSLYRSFPSKDRLAAAYLHEFSDDYWERFEQSANEHPDDPRAQLLAVFERLVARAAHPAYRGCALTNAVVEYPDVEHPARQEAQAHKRDLRARLTAMATRMGARDPGTLGDGLLLLLEGAYVTGQMFRDDSPLRALVVSAQRLIDASLVSGSAAR